MLPKILLAFLVAGSLASAQTPDASTISVSAKLVVVPAVVRDKKGALLNDLARDEFALRVDGKPQPMRYFDHDADVPLTLGLLVDTSQSQRTLLDDERTASAAFLDKMLASADNAFILSFDVAVRRLADVTSSRAPLDKALLQLNVPQPDFSNVHRDSGARANGRLGIFNPEVRDALRAVVGTKLFDAVYYSAHNITAGQKDRRALILLTDGGDHGSAKSLEQAIEAAQRADTVVYAIYYVAESGANRALLRDAIRTGSEPASAPAGEIVVPASTGMGGVGGAQMSGKKVLEHLCGETGGKVFEVSKKLSVAAIYAKIAEELRAQYRLGFSPPAGAGYHRIEVTVSRKGKHVIQTRDGFYAGAK